MSIISDVVSYVAGVVTSGVAIKLFEKVEADAKTVVADAETDVKAAAITVETVSKL